MPDITSVMKALKTCASPYGECGNCPYYRSSDDRCTNKLMLDALKLLEQKQKEDAGA